MSTQYFGNALPGQNLTIVAEKIGNDIVLSVDDQGSTDLRFTGEYFRAPIANYNSLILRGTDADNETFIIRGDLGVDVRIETANATGKDEVYVADGDVVAGTQSHRYTFETTTTNNNVTYQRLSRAFNGGVSHAVDATGVSRFGLFAAQGGSIIAVNQAVVPLDVNGGEGKDHLSVGTDTLGLSGLKNNVLIAGGKGSDTLDIIDFASKVKSQYTFEKTPQGTGVRLSYTNGVQLDTDTLEKYTLLSANAPADITVKYLPQSVTDGILISPYQQLTAGDEPSVFVGNAPGPLSDVAGKVVITGNKFAKVVIDDTGSNPGSNIVVNGTTVTWGVGSVTYPNATVEVFISSGNGGSFKLNAAKGPTKYFLNGTRVALGNAAGKLDDLATSITVTGPGSLTIDDTGTADSSYLFTDGLLTVPRLPDFNLTYSQVESLDIATGSGADAFEFDADFSGVGVTVTASDGDDTLSVLGGVLVDPTLSGVETLNLSGGLFAGDDAFDAVNWTYGTLSGAGTVSGKVAISGSSPKVLETSAVLANSGTGTWTGGDITGGGTLRNLSGASLSADGTLVGLFDNHGVLTLGTLAVTGGFTQASTGSLYFDLDDTFAVNGSVTLAGQLLVSGTPTQSVYTVLSHDGSSPITGQFDGMPERFVTTIGGVPYRLSYIGGDGNDVTLTRVYRYIVDVTGPFKVSGGTHVISLAANPSFGTFYAATSAEAASAALGLFTGGVDVTWQGKSASYPFVASDVGSKADHKAYALYQPNATGTPNLWQLGLEDLQASNMQSLGVDWDYNDQYWKLNVTQVTAPVISIVAGTSASEVGQTPGTFVLTRTDDGVPFSSPLTVTLNYGGGPAPAALGPDYSAPTTVTFAANSKTATITATPLRDSRVEGTETIQVTVAAGSGYLAHPTVGQRQASIGLADDPPIVSVVRISDASEVGPTAGRFRFTRTGGNPSLALTVSYTLGGTAVAADYGLSPTGTLQFAANKSTVDLVLSPVADGVAEGPETVVVTVNTNTTLNTNGHIATGSPATLTITDTPVVAVTASTDATEGGTAGTFTLTRSGGDLTLPLTVWFTFDGTATNAMDYTVIGATFDSTRQQYSVTFPADTSGSGSATTTTVTIVAAEDTISDPDETVTLTLASGSTAYVIGSPSSQSIDIIEPGELVP